MRRFLSGKFPSLGTPHVQAASPHTAPAADNRFVANAWRARPVRLLVVCGLLLGAVIAIGTGIMLSDLRNRALSGTERELRNIASILAEQSDRELTALALVQSSVIERLKIASLDDFDRRMSGQDVHAMLNDKINGLPHVRALALVNSQGKLLNYSGVWDLPNTDISDWSFLKTVQSGTEQASFLSESVRNPAKGTWNIYLARKFTGPNGEFLGFVLGAIETRYFERYFKTIALGQDSSIAFIRRDAILLARHPHVDGTIGSSFAQNPLFKDVLSKANAGVARLRSLVDGHDRVIAGHVLPNFPAVIAVGTTVEAIFAEWQNAAIYIISAALFMLSLIGAVIFLSARQVEKKLREQNIRLDAALNNMSQGLSMFDAAQRVVVCNDRYARMYGLTADQVKPGTTLRQIVEQRIAKGVYAGPSPDDYIRERLAPVTEVSSTIQELSDGRSVVISRQPLAGGGWVTTHEDITERRQAERERDRARVLLDKIIDTVPVTIIVREARDRRYVLINRACEDFFGVSRAQILGRTPHDIYSKPVADMVTRLDEQMLQSASETFFDEHWIETPGKGQRLITSTVLPIPGDDGQPQYVVAVINDMTEQKRADAQIVHMAHHDALTDLPNRVLFYDRLENELAHVRRGGRLAILYLDLDHFKRTNDTLGHSTGDELLKSVAGRLRECVRDTDIIARLGGDEFAIIQTALERPSDAAGLATRIREAIRPPYDLHGHQVVVDVSIGISIAPDDASDRDQLLKNADMALFGAKTGGRGTYCYYEPEMDARMKARRKFEMDLRKGLVSGEFELFYQPVVNLARNEISGCEALLRWRHPERGLVAPSEFIQIAEEIALIIPLGEWVLRKACADAAAWPNDIKVAVNLSPAQLASKDFLPVVINALATSGLAADRLEFEITESVLMQNTFATLSALHQLRELKVRIAMDDFGTGYSSLSYLRSFPFNKIKIDRSFIVDLSNNESSHAIVRAITGLASDLNMTTTAEGVETQQQLDLAKALGCTEMQGFFFSSPKPVAQIVREFLSPTRRAESAA
jgi:diguanylate cyclase (GGDEF)-like protein/PAS domain S-box-containing protein